ncbi:hypothetical protein pipiens_019043 [Culex pipiens pipiens]|uniref:Large ribosomal subunit protein uL30-like ferredoxin-like fold domain-containing protein n=1 Tax=Culex pipiens pipiens TaxID=38569 RepID=A0ABD1DWN5_CULPP
MRGQEGQKHIRSAEPKVTFVIRIRGINKVRKLLQLFRLRQINNATFIKLNKTTKNKLRIADPYGICPFLHVLSSVIA